MQNGSMNTIIIKQYKYDPVTKASGMGSLRMPRRAIPA
jgi:hypothetical protein